MFCAYIEPSFSWLVDSRQSAILVLTWPRIMDLRDFSPAVPSACSSASREREEAHPVRVGISQCRRIPDDLPTLSDSKSAGSFLLHSVWTPTRISIHPR